MERRDVELNKQEHDALAADDQRIAELLGTLTRVEAPGNFEFGVRARIAAGAESRRSPLLPFLKFAAPLTLVIVVGVFAVLYNSTPTTDSPLAEAPSSADSSQVVESSTQPRTALPEQFSRPSGSEPVASGPMPSGSTTPSRQIQPVMVADRPGGKQTVRNNRTLDVPVGGGSRDETISPSNTIQPRGIGESDIPVVEVFSILGITAEFKDGSWKVKSAGEGSVSAKSGVRAGDILDSIDGRHLDNSTSFKTPFSGKTIRVRRDGKELDLNLGN